MDILTKYGRFNDAIQELKKIQKGGGKAGSDEEILPKIRKLKKLKASAIEAEEFFQHDEDYQGKR